MSMWLTITNIAVAAVSMGFAITAVVSPAVLARSETVASTRYYAAMYAARAVPIAVAVLALAFAGVPANVWVAVLAIAGAAQVGDAFIGINRRITGQTAGAAIAGSAHLASMAYLLATA